MLLHLAIGDAFGAGFEYAPIWQQSLNTGLQYVQHPTHKTVRPGCYTDDTQMAIGIAEHLIEGRPTTRVDFAETFVRTYQRDRRDGYNQGFQSLLGSCRTGIQLVTSLHAGSNKNGAAMRAAPAGFIRDPRQVVAFTTNQAAVTHDSLEGTGGAIAVALAAHYFLYRVGPKAGVLAFVKEHLPKPMHGVLQLDTPWGGDAVGSPANEAVRAALTAVLNETSLSAVLTRCVGYGGDTDTVAAIGMALASCVQGMVEDIAPALYDGLEQGKYGRQYLEGLDVLLANLSDA